METVRLYCGGASKSLQMPWNHHRSHEIKRLLLLGSKVMTNMDSILKSRHYFANKGLSSQGYGFSSSHVWKWELDTKESWMLKNWCFELWCWRRLVKSPLDCKEIQPVHPKRDDPGCSLEGLMLKLILWLPISKSWLIWKDPDAGNNWRQENEMTLDEMVGWHHWLNGHEFG